MKNTITTLLDGCRPEELDGMLNDIDPPMPDEANAENISSLAAQKAGAAKRADHRRIFLAAACIALVAAMLLLRHRIPFRPPGADRRAVRPVRGRNP